jgi:hypothetical protein
VNEPKTVEVMHQGRCSDVTVNVGLPGKPLVQEPPDPVPVKLALVMSPAIEVPLLVVNVPTSVDWVQVTFPNDVLKIMLPEFVPWILDPDGTVPVPSLRTGDADAMAGTAAKARSPTTVARIRLYMR